VQRTSTKINICDEKMCKEIEHDMEYLLGALQIQVEHREPQLDMKDLDLVIEQMPSGVRGYYFINHRDKCLFWLGKFNVEAGLPYCKGIKNLACIGLWFIFSSWPIGYDHS